MHYAAIQISHEYWVSPRPPRGSGGLRGRNPGLRFFSAAVPEMPDQDTININEEQEVQYWAKLFGVREEELRRAIERAGNNVVDVAVELNSKAA